MSRGFGLYVHLPFCTHRCSYCDFFSSTKYTDDKFSQIITTIESELKFHSADLSHKQWPQPVVDTVFIGGGTPSLFPVPLLNRLFETISKQFPWAPGAEITMEANPETLSVEYLRALKSSTPVNRISMGAQTFHPDHLKTLERQCTAQQVRDAADLVRQAGYENFNLDLIFAIPGQSIEQSLQDIEQAAELAPTHISRYQLTLQPGHKLFAQLPDEDFQADAYEAGVSLLEARGYGLYEISNFAKPEYQCRHNLLYWTGGDFLGVGPSASSRMFVQGVFHHRKQVSDLNAYLQGAEQGWSGEWQSTTPEQSFLEAAFLELRTRDGVCLKDFHDRYGFDLTQSKKLPLFKSESLVEELNGLLRLTARGRLLADGISRDLAEY
jgi:putative oxygen-independent coproporphyrinogen III oxidase